MTTVSCPYLPDPSYLGACRIKDVCEGQKQIPFMKENESGKWLYDSDKMVPYLEDKFPDLKKTGKPDECPQV